MAAAIRSVVLLAVKIGFSLKIYTISLPSSQKETIGQKNVILWVDFVHREMKRI